MGFKDEDSNRQNSQEEQALAATWTAGITQPVGTRARGAETGKE